MQRQLKGMGTGRISWCDFKVPYLTPYQEHNSGGQFVACNLQHILGQLLPPKDIAGYDIMKLKSDNAATAALSSMQTKGQKGGTITKAKLFSE